MLPHHIMDYHIMDYHIMDYHMIIWSIKYLFYMSPLHLMDYHFSPQHLSLDLYFISLFMIYVLLIYHRYKLLAF